MPNASSTTTLGPARTKRSALSKIIYAVRVVLVNFILFAALVELLCIGFVHWKKWPSTRPSYHLNFNSFFIDTNPVVGIWHRPNTSYQNQEGCFSVENVTNSYGARDIERSVHSTQPRTIVLGDSFMEGWGLPADERLSNILEKRTGLEHLNFGSGGGFSPLQYSLVYKTLAANFDHKYVLVGILPDNDFHEMDGPWLSANYPGQYRPYYKDDFSISYLGQLRPEAGEAWGDRVEAVLRAYLASYHVGQYLYTRTLDRPFGDPYSGYNDYSDVDLSRLKKAVLDIKSTADAHGAKIWVFMIPRFNDFERLRQRGTNRLGPAMESWGHNVRIPVKDLLPEMEARAEGNDRSYFLPCDAHWSSHGASVAADIVEPWVYGRQ